MLVVIHGGVIAGRHGQRRGAAAPPELSSVPTGIGRRPRLGTNESGQPDLDGPVCRFDTPLDKIEPTSTDRGTRDTPRAAHQ